MLTDNQGSILLRLARQTVEEILDQPVSEPVSKIEMEDPAFDKEQGIFVTFKIESKLRGCIGSLLATESILAGTQRHAKNAAFFDQRFPKLTSEELKNTTIDISVLSEPILIDCDSPEDLLEKLKKETPGVILKGKGSLSATFLPQVWEQLPDPMVFLAQLCRKAGMTDQAWKAPHIDILTYTVQSFQENR